MQASEAEGIADSAARVSEGEARFLVPAFLGCGLFSGRSERVGG